MGYLKKRQANLLILLCWVAYVSAYIGRRNYSAGMTLIIDAFHAPEGAAGLVTSFFSVTYGIGQLVNGLLSRWKHYNTKYVVSAALLVSSLCNLGMSLCTDVGAMKYLWLINGIAQSSLWSSLLKTQGKYLSRQMISRAVLVMSTTVALGTFAAYGLTALFSALGCSWQWVFRIAAGVMIAAALSWFAGMHTIERAPLVQEALPDDCADAASEKAQNRKTPFGSVLLISVVIVALCAIFNGFVNEGIQSWTPKLLQQEFGVDSSLSILLTLLLPLLAIGGTALVTVMRRRFPDVLGLNMIYYLISALVLGVVIATLSLRNVPLTLILLCVVSIMMSAINNIVTSVIPLISRDAIDSGVSAGVLDTFCYVGNSISATLLGSMIEGGNGWNRVLFCLLAISAAGAVVGAFSLFSSKARRQILHWD